MEPFLRDAAAGVKLCKVYGLGDAREADPFWQDLLQQLCPDWESLGPLHRKYWEWGIGLYGLHKLGCIRPDAVGLGVAAGVEWPLFYLANHVHRVHATDLYSDDSSFRGADPTVAENAARQAPFPYRRESLVFQRMDALDLRFPDDTFDFVFSFSSIEHLGGRAGAALAMLEIARVLKPGGVAAIATELILQGPRHPEFFMPDEIEPCFVGASGLEFVEPLDLSVDAELISKPVRFDLPEINRGNTGPHTSVLYDKNTFTSIEFFLRKPNGWKPAARPSMMLLKARRQAWLMEQGARPQVTQLVRRVLDKAARIRAAMKS